MNFHAVLQETSGIFLSKGLHFATIVCNKKALPIYYVQFMGSFQPLSFTFQQLSILNIAWLCRRPESFCVILYSPPQVTFYERAWKKQRVERDTGALAAAMLLLLQCVFCSNHWETTLQTLPEFEGVHVSARVDKRLEHSAVSQRCRSKRQQCSTSTSVLLKSQWHMNNLHRISQVSSLHVSRKRKRESKRVQDFGAGCPGQREPGRTSIKGTAPVGKKRWRKERVNWWTAAFDKWQMEWKGIGQRSGSLRWKTLAGETPRWPICYSSNSSTHTKQKSPHHQVEPLTIPPLFCFVLQPCCI